MILTVVAMPFFVPVAVFNLVPVIFLIGAVTNKLGGDKEEAKDTKNLALACRMVETIFEALPQAALQIYIAGQTNRLDPLLIVSILSSLWSVVSGLFKGSFSLADEEAGMAKI